MAPILTVVRSAESRDEVGVDGQIRDDQASSVRRRHDGPHAEMPVVRRVRRRIGDDAARSRSLDRTSHARRLGRGRAGDATDRRERTCSSALAGPFGRRSRSSAAGTTASDSAGYCFARFSYFRVSALWVERGVATDLAGRRLRELVDVVDQIAKAFAKHVRRDVDVQHDARRPARRPPRESPARSRGRRRTESASGGRARETADACG